MKIRTKIAIWTSSFALLAAVIFSGIVFYELIEQPFRLIDRDLRELGETIITNLTAEADGALSLEKVTFPPFSDRYWIKIEAENGDILFQTPLAGQVDFQPRDSRGWYSVAKDKAPGAQQTYFRVRTSDKTIGGRRYKLVLAKPIPELVHEIHDLCVGLAALIPCCIIIAGFSGYYLAGKILKPFSIINKLILEISEKNLEKRIPVGTSRDELSILASSLNGMFDRLQYSFNRQKEFVGNAAHELKSPLTILLLNIEELLAKDLPENVNIGLLRHQEILRRLSKLVRSLLEISRMENRISVKMEPFDLTGQILHVLDEFSEVVQMKGIKIETRLQVRTIRGDSEKMQRMFINLVDNAIKYNLRGNGRIWIDTRHLDDGIRITVANTGQSIPDAALPRIFDQFFRVEPSRSSTFGGFGLGLTIVMRIVQLHRGTISATSGVDGVTQLIIDMPQA